MLFRQRLNPERPDQSAARPLRVLCLVHRFFPAYRLGTEKFVLQLAGALQARGHQVQVVTSTPGRAWRWQLWRRLLGVTFWQRRYRYAGVDVLAVRQLTRLAANYRQVEDENQRTFARQLMQRWQPEIVHVGHAMHVSGFVWAAHDLGIPTVLTLTDYWFICPKITLLNSQGFPCPGPAAGATCQRTCPELDPAFIRRRLALAEQVVRRAAAVVAPSRYLAEVFQDEWPWLTPQVVPHGVKPWTQHRRQYGPASPLVFAYAGSLTRHKGVHVLIEAFRGVKSTAVRLRIYGTGPAERPLREQAASDPRVQFCGLYDEHTASAVFAEMDVLIAPSLWPENRPFVVHEALATGVPVVISNVGGMAESIKHNVTGLMTKAGDALALQTALQGLVDQPEQLNRFKAAIAELALPTVAGEADAYETLYRDAKGQPR